MDKEQHLKATNDALAKAPDEQLTDHQRTNLLLASIAHTLAARETEEHQEARLLV